MELEAGARARALPAAVFGFLLLVPVSARGAEGGGDAPSFDTLVELNAEALFGGKLERKEGRFTLRFPGDGSFEKGFEARATGRGGLVSNLEELKSAALRKLLLEGHKGAPSFVGFDGGSALSRFELEDEFRIRFRLRMPRLGHRAAFVWMLHQQSRASYVQVSSFQEILVRGKKGSRARTQDARFAKGLDAWFDRGAEGMPVAIESKRGRITVRVGVKEKDKEEMVEVVAVEAESPGAGRIGLSFDDLSFLITDLVIDGKFPRKWAEEELERLRKARKLRTESPVAVARDGDGEGGTVNRVKKRQGPDLEKPDPEADDEL